MYRFNYKIYYRFVKPYVRLCSNYNLERIKYIYKVLKPHLDFDEKLLNLNSLKNSIHLRGLDIKLDPLIALWKHDKTVKADIKNTEQDRVNVSTEIKQINDEDKINSLKLRATNFREKLKTLKLISAELESQIYPSVLQLPNDVLIKDTESVYSNSVSKSNSEDHLTVGKRLNILEYRSPMVYFLFDSAAMFELNVSNEITKLFLKNGFVQFSNPDFTRNSIVKYLKLSDLQSLFTLEKIHDDEDLDILNLQGGASILPFCCYHHKTVAEMSSLPIKYVTKGRRYAQTSDLPGLYGVWQNTSVQVFIGSNKEMIDDQLNTLINISIDFYKYFVDIPVRFVYCKPEELGNSESLAISIQSYSSATKQHIELGRISLYGDYLSKRFRMYYKENEEYKFLNVISGTIVKIAPLLAALLEYKQDCNVHFNN